MKRFWLFLLLVAFLTRLAAALYWDDRVRSAAFVPGVAPSELAQIVDSPQSARPAPSDGPFFFGDSDSYWKLGRALAFGRPYRFDEERRWEIFRTPGYPALLAPLFWTFGENPPVFAARFLGVCFGTANVGLVGLLAFAYFRRRSVAALSGVVAAFEPTLVFESVLVLSEEPFLTFALLQHLVALDVARRLGLLALSSADFSPSKSANSPD
ncbi:MAG: phospholipid carrier-dependent glycosyltransferase, partial [Thermoguttaceae bacterium]|nr:phospholipid carrier-dependent glycosyltransferase [Thermoguttaceae bacterium]